MHNQINNSGEIPRHH